MKFQYVKVLKSRQKWLAYSFGVNTTKQDQSNYDGIQFVNPFEVHSLGKIKVSS